MASKLTGIHQYRVGDYVEYIYSKKTTYRGHVREVEDEFLTLDICLTRKINENNVIERIQVTAEDVRPLIGTVEADSKVPAVMEG